jgi:hypothetical protein
MRKLREKLEKYNIETTNIFNFDEKGFSIGISKSKMRIFTRTARETGRLIGASQDGSREWITLVACVGADGSHLPPALIYKGESHDLQDSWLEDFDHSKELAYFASTENGWSCETLGLHWLERVFDQHTKEKASRGRRLLIVDGHSTHVNLKFINYCDMNRILLAVLPPHSTHRLQPLDVGLFSPLSTYYSEEIDNLIAGSQGLVAMAKRHFWAMFRVAWERAFTKLNTESAWRATGIHPFCPEKIISQVEIKEPSPEPQGIVRTPETVRSLRRLDRQIKEGHISREAGHRLLLHAGVKAMARHDIANHENKGLRQAISMEKKKRQRGKAMGLIFEGGSPNQPLFFSPAKVARVRQRHAEQEDAERQRKQAMEDKKIQSQIAREEKVRKAQERKAERTAARIAAKEQREREKVERAAERYARRVARLAEAKERQEMAAAKKAERAAAKETREKASNSRKRPLVEDQSEVRRKRPCAKPAGRRSKQDINNSASESVIQAIGLEGSTTSTVMNAQPVANRTNTGGGAVSRSLRSGRAIKLPARFK